MINVNRVTVLVYQQAVPANTVSNVLVGIATQLPHAVMQAQEQLFLPMPHFQDGLMGWSF